VHRITSNCIAPCVSASHHAPLQFIRKFNISSFDVQDQHAALQALRSICVFGSASDGLQKLQLS
jgi:hypothetical protein